MRLVFYAQELYVSGDNNLLTTISKSNATGFVNKILFDRDSILSILSTPTTFDTTQNAILVNCLSVKTQDNTVFRINAYINPAAFKNKKTQISLKINSNK